jgi:hypothetical protein
MSALQALAKHFRYDPKTGKFTDIELGKRSAAIGGKHERGTVRISRMIDGVRVYAKAHRLAFHIMTGRTDFDQVDHIDSDTSNNRWANLREATQAQNQANKAPRRWRRLPKGVTRRESLISKPYVASITANKKRHHIGCFETPDLAAEAYRQAAAIHHGEFARVAR